MTLRAALEEVTGRALGAGRHGDDGDDAPVPLGLSSRELTRIAELTPRLVAAGRDAEFESGVELINTGLRAALARTKA